MSHSSPQAAALQVGLKHNIFRKGQKICHALSKEPTINTVRRNHPRNAIFMKK